MENEIQFHIHRDSSLDIIVIQTDAIHIPLFLRSILLFFTIYAYISKVVSLSRVPCMPHLSLPPILMKNTNYEAPRFASFSIILRLSVE